MREAFLRSAQKGIDAHDTWIEERFSWDGRRSQFFFRIVPDSCADEKLIAFLDQLHKEFRRRRLILVWDGLPSHRSLRMQEYLGQYPGKGIGESLL
jgi:hypothetical protein